MSEIDLDKFGVTQDTEQVVRVKVNQEIVNALDLDRVVKRLDLGGLTEIPLDRPKDTKGVQVTLVFDRPQVQHDKVEDVIDPIAIRDSVILEGAEKAVRVRESTDRLLRVMVNEEGMDEFDLDRIMGALPLSLEVGVRFSRLRDKKDIVIELDFDFE